jgi:hypothetical protein
MSPQVCDLQLRLRWSLQDLAAHTLLAAAREEVALHVAGLPPDLTHLVHEQVDSGSARLLGDGGSALVSCGYMLG